MRPREMQVLDQAGLSQEVAQRGLDERQAIGGGNVLAGFRAQVFELHFDGDQLAVDDAHAQFRREPLHAARGEPRAGHAFDRQAQGGPGSLGRCQAARASANAARAAASVASTSRAPCALDTNPASNAEGAR